MIDWAARARAQLAQQRQGGGDETDETQVLSVLSVGPLGFVPANERLSSVSSAVSYLTSIEFVGSAGNIGAMAVNDSSAVLPSLVRGSGNPYLTADQGDECHAGGWDDVEIAAFLARVDRFTRMGIADAEALAEWLILRDRRGEDHRLCLECRGTEATGRCDGSSSDWAPGIGRRSDSAQTDFVRCSQFQDAVTAFRANKGP